MALRGLASTWAGESFSGEERGWFGCLLIMKGPHAHQLLITVFLEL